MVSEKDSFSPTDEGVTGFDLKTLRELAECEQQDGDWA